MRHQYIPFADRYRESCRAYKRASCQQSFTEPCESTNLRGNDSPGNDSVTLSQSSDHITPWAAGGVILK